MSDNIIDMAIKSLPAEPPKKLIFVARNKKEYELAKKYFSNNIEVILSEYIKL